MTNTIIRWLLGPVQKPILDKTKTVVVTGVATVLTYVASQQVFQAFGFELSQEQISGIAIAAGGLVAGFVAELMQAYRKGGTKALQELLNTKYGLKLKADDWFGPVTQGTVAEILDDEQEAAAAKVRVTRKRRR